MMRKTIGRSSTFQSAHLSPLLFWRPCFLLISLRDRNVIQVWRARLPSSKTYTKHWSALSHSPPLVKPCLSFFSTRLGMWSRSVEVRLPPLATFQKRDGAPPCPVRAPPPSRRIRKDQYKDAHFFGLSRGKPWVLFPPFFPFFPLSGIPPNCAFLEKQGFSPFGAHGLGDGFQPFPLFFSPWAQAP